MRSEWLLDPDVTYLNHGTVGATPRRVLEHQRAITDEIERQPAKFMLRELADSHRDFTEPSRMRVAAAAVAEFVGVAGEDLMFVDNITTGANAILRSFPFDHGDEIAVTNLGYGGVVNAATYVTRTIGGTLRTIEIPQPGAERGDYIDAIAAGLGERTRVLIVDHLTPGSASDPAARGDRRAVPRTWRVGAGRRRARARQHRRRHRVVRRRLVRGQPAQVGVGAAQRRPVVGRQAASRVPASRP